MNTKPFGILRNLFKRFLTSELDELRITKTEASEIFKTRVPALGEKYILIGGCPECGSDLEIVSGVMVTCVNWQHPNIPEIYYRGGKRNCHYSLMSG